MPNTGERRRFATNNTAAKSLVRAHFYEHRRTALNPSGAFPKPCVACSNHAGGALEIAGPQASEQVLYQLRRPDGRTVDLP